MAVGTCLSFRPGRLRDNGYGEKARGILGAILSTCPCFEL